MVGSATLLFACNTSQGVVKPKSDATLMTEYSENLSVVMSQNGRRSYFFETPLLEGYTLGNEPYREFRRGIKITTYQDDSLTTVNAVLTANYAIYYDQRELWEAKGNVEVHKYDGTEVYTQQLFWNARTKQIYSNVDTKLVKGNNVTVGERFESDEDFHDWRFRYQKSRMEVEMEPRDENDTIAVRPASSRRTSRPAPTLSEPVVVRNVNNPSAATRQSKEQKLAPAAPLQPRIRERRGEDPQSMMEMKSIERDDLGRANSGLRPMPKIDQQR